MLHACKQLVYSTHCAHTPPSPNGTTRGSSATRLFIRSRTPSVRRPYTKSHTVTNNSLNAQLVNLHRGANSNSSLVACVRKAGRPSHANKRTHTRSQTHPTCNQLVQPKRISQPTCDTFCTCTTTIAYKCERCHSKPLNAYRRSLPNGDCIPNKQSMRVSHTSAYDVAYAKRTRTVRTTRARK